MDACAVQRDRRGRVHAAALRGAAVGRRDRPRRVGGGWTKHPHGLSSRTCTPTGEPGKAAAVRTLTFGMNGSLDGYIAAPDDDLGWSVPSDELFQWWSDRVAGTGLALYGRRLWEAMSSLWPTADQRPGATPAEIEFARRWRDMPKVVFSSTISTVAGNARLVSGDAVAEISRLKSEDGGRMDIGGATLAAAAMRARLIGVRDRHPPGV